MAKRYIKLGDGRMVSLGVYVQAIKTAKANPTVTYPTGIDDRWPTTGAEIYRRFLQGMDERINQARPYIDRGRAP